MQCISSSDLIHLITEMFILFYPPLPTFPDSWPVTTNFLLFLGIWFFFKSPHRSDTMRYFICLPRLCNDQATTISPEHPRTVQDLLSAGGDFAEWKPKATRTLYTLGQGELVHTFRHKLLGQSEQRRETAELDKDPQCRATRRGDSETPTCPTVKSESRSVVSDSATPWTIQSVEFSRPGYWSAFPFSKGSSQPRDGTQVFRIARGFFTSWATNSRVMVNQVTVLTSRNISHFKCSWRVHNKKIL